MALDQAAVKARLAGWQDPLTGEDPVTAGALKGVAVDGAKVSVAIQFAYPCEALVAERAAAIAAWLEADPAIDAAVAEISWRVFTHKVQGELTPIPSVRNVIAVASGKGGVGKSTTTANLALALAAEGATVGVLDADIYGPSMPRMLGMTGKPDVVDNAILPKVNHGLQTMSIGYLIEEDTPMVWRGPMVTQALQQLLNDTRWSDLDYLFIDLPPGTGDIQLTLSQRVPVSGAVIVTTPQDIALLDARKGLKMFEKVGVPVLGIVENMSTHVCSNCGHEEPIFGTGGGARMAADYGVELLGSLPLHIDIREQADRGEPTVVAAPTSPAALAYRDIARRAAARLSQQARSRKIQVPNIKILKS